MRIATLVAFAAASALGLSACAQKADNASAKSEAQAAADHAGQAAIQAGDAVVDAAQATAAAANDAAAEVKNSADNANADNSTDNNAAAAPADKK